MSGPAATLLQAWTYRADAPGTGWVLPDGCRDLILVLAPGAAPRWMVSALDDGPRAVPVPAAVTLHGWRLRPGAAIREAALLAAVGRLADPTDAAAVASSLAAHTTQVPAVAEALEALAACPQVGLARRHLGVSERALQRLLGPATGRPPAYWAGLARARSAARALPDGRPLAALALDHGYADQAHLARAMRRWFGLSPARLRVDPSRQGLLAAPGYDPPSPPAAGGGAIGEHSSTRKPSGSVT